VLVVAINETAGGEGRRGGRSTPEGGTFASFAGPLATLEFEI
jgi:hypothetical protein